MYPSDPDAKRSNGNRIQHKFTGYCSIDLDLSKIVSLRLRYILDVMKATAAASVPVEARSVEKRFPAVLAFLWIAALVTHVPHQTVLTRVAGAARVTGKSTVLP